MSVCLMYLVLIGKRRICLGGTLSVQGMSVVCRRGLGKIHVVVYGHDVCCAFSRSAWERHGHTRCMFTGVFGRAVCVLDIQLVCTGELCGCVHIVDVYRRGVCTVQTRCVQAALCATDSVCVGGGCMCAVQTVGVYGKGVCVCCTYSLLYAGELRMCCTDGVCRGAVCVLCRQRRAVCAVNLSRMSPLGSSAGGLRCHAWGQCPSQTLPIQLPVPSRARSQGCTWSAVGDGHTSVLGLSH